jgi:hypothetical protein
MIWKRERDRPVTKFRKRPRSFENVYDRPRSSMIVQASIKKER